MWITELNGPVPVPFQLLRKAPRKGWLIHPGEARRGAVIGTINELRRELKRPAIVQAPMPPTETPAAAFLDIAVEIDAQRERRSAVFHAGNLRALDTADNLAILAGIEHGNAGEELHA